MNSLFLKIQKVKLDLVLISILLFVSRMAFPGLKYLFIPVFLVSLIPFFTDIPSLFNINIVRFIKNIWQFLLLGLFMCSGLVLTNKIILLSLKETINFFIYIVFLAQLYFLSDKFLDFTDRLIRYFILLSVIISIVALVRFFISFYGTPVFGTSLVSDYNFYSLYIFLGFIAVFYKCLLRNKKTYKLENFLLIILFLNISFSFSRRSVVVLLLIIFILTIFLLCGFFKISYFKYLRRFLVFFIFSLSFLFIFISYLLLPSGVKRIVTNAFGIKYSDTRNVPNALYYRYFTIFNNNITYEDIERKYFILPFKPEDPDTWESRTHKTIYPLKGKNVEIVPNDAKGYMLDSTCNASTWSNNAYAYTIIGNDSTKAGDIIHSSVFCFVSEDFDGTWARISAEKSAVGIKEDYYDLDHKGTWQKLSITVQCEEGTVPVYLYISMNGVTDFKKMKGHVIFAYPEYEKPSFIPKDPDTWGIWIHRTIYPLAGKNVEIVPNDAKGYMLDSTCNASTWYNNAYAFTMIGNDSAKPGDIIHSSVFCFVSENFDGTWVRISAEGSSLGIRENYYDLEHKGTWQKLSITLNCEEGTVPVYLYISKYGVTDFKNLKGYIIFAFPQYNVNRSADFSYLDKTEEVIKMGVLNLNLNHFVTPFFKTFQDITDSIALDQKLKILQEKKLTGSRLSRWYYACYMFLNEFKWYEKLIGNGFGYLEKFGKKFYPEENRLDYPHNPILSSLLYSGIIGALFYSYFLGLVFYYYWKYRRYHMVFFIMYLVTFFFVFFSDNSHFNTPVFTFLSLIPFITKFQIENGDLINLSKIDLVEGST